LTQELRKLKQEKNRIKNRWDGRGFTATVPNGVREKYADRFPTKIVPVLLNGVKIITPEYKTV
jgi:hypothetical protein